MNGECYDDCNVAAKTTAVYEHVLDVVVVLSYRLLHVSVNTIILHFLNILRPFRVFVHALLVEKRIRLR